MKKKKPFGDSDFLSVVLACAVVGGGLWLFANSMQSPIAGQQKSVSQPRQPVARPAPLPPRAPSPPATRIQPRPPVAAQRPNAQDRRALAKLTETCRYWTQRNTRGENAAMQASACNDMQRLARQSNQSAPGVTLRKARPKTNTTPVAPKVFVRIDDCRRFGYKSIDYRRCRAKEKERLRKQCRHYTQRLNVSRGDHRRTYIRNQEAWCQAYNQYLVIN